MRTLLRLSIACTPALPVKTFHFLHLCITGFHFSASKQIKISGKFRENSVNSRAALSWRRRYLLSPPGRPASEPAAFFGRSASFPRGVPRLATQAAQLDAAVQRRFRSPTAVSEFSGDRGLRRHPHVFNFPLYRPVRAFLSTLRKFSRCHFSSAAWRVLLTGVPMRIQAAEPAGGLAAQLAAKR